LFLQVLFRVKKEAVGSSETIVSWKKLHGAITRKTSKCFFTALRTSNISRLPLFFGYCEMFNEAHVR
jgi:hypothetical protein